MNGSAASGSLIRAWLSTSSMSSGEQPKTAAASCFISTASFSVAPLTAPRPVTANCDAYVPENPAVEFQYVSRPARTFTSVRRAAEILGCTPDDANVRAGHDTYWNSTAGFSGTYASQFAVTGLAAVKGATEKLAVEMKQLAAAVFGCSPDDIELAEGQARIKGNPEAALPFMALGAILNANNAGLPPDLDVTLNIRHVYRPQFEKPDLERKFGNLTLTYATQIHACALEIDPETGVYEIVDYAAVDDCGNRIHPQIVEGQVHGATAQALGAATHEIFTYDEEGNLLTPNFYDYHVPHALDMPPMKNGFIESESPFTPLGAKGMGEGGGAGIHAVCAALQNALGRRGEGADRPGVAATPTRVCGICCRSLRKRAS